MENSFFHLLLLMGIAISMVWSFRRVNLPPILAYLACGLGPDLLALFYHEESIHFVAELGIVFCSLPWD